MIQTKITYPIKKCAIQNWRIFLKLTILFHNIFSYITQFDRKIEFLLITFFKIKTKIKKWSKRNLQFFFLDEQFTY